MLPYITEIEKNYITEIEKNYITEIHAIVTHF